MGENTYRNVPFWCSFCLNCKCECTCSCLTNDLPILYVLSRHIACKESNKSFITGEIEETSLDRLGEDGEDRGRGWDGSAHKRSSVNTDRNGEIQQRFRQIPPRRCTWAPWWCAFCFGIHECSCKCSCSC